MDALLYDIGPSDRTGREGKEDEVESRKKMMITTVMVTIIITFYSTISLCISHTLGKERRHNSPHKKPPTVHE